MASNGSDIQIQARHLAQPLQGIHRLRSSTVQIRLERQARERLRHWNVSFQKFQVNVFIIIYNNDYY